MGEEEGMGGQGQGCVGQGPNVGKGFYEQSLQALLGAMFDSSAKVQVAACSALCVLVEASFYVPKLRGDNSNGGLDGGVGGGGGGGGGGDGGDGGEENVLIPHLPAILSAVSRAFEAYGARSSLILVDTVGTLADTVREELRGPHLTSLYLPPLMHKLGQLEDFDMRMFPLLECLTSVLSVVGLDAQPYVLSVYHRCITLLGAVVGAYAAAGAGSGGAVAGNYQDLPCKDFAICSLDVVSALSEGLGGAFVGLVNDTQTGGVLLQLMFACIRDDLPELRQSGFSLSGEVCKQSFPLLAAQPESVPQLLSLCISALDTDYPLVCNNAAWTIGELALQVGGAFLQDHVPRAMLCLITALQTAHLPDNLRVNVAVTIGRLAMVDTLEVAELADEYFADWCSVLELPCPTAEKTHAFTGLLSVLHRNPQ
ncbi:armadillo-type protein [Ochromonadaceae sp. CCMP2298]|nr:armadillo-type protein [Ochromonadaceae sp. CCMP2298]